MTDLRISGGDLDLSTGTVELVDDSDAVAQQLLIRLRIFLGEWFLDERVGMPYFQRILGQKFNEALIAPIFQKAILAVPRVASVDSFAFSLDRAARALSLSFKVRTDLGEELIFDDVVIVE
jgi:hypothetical protein